MATSSSPFNSLLSSNNPEPYDFSSGDLTEQAHAPGLDANNILSLSQLADASPPSNENYGDFSKTPLDLQAKMNTVIAGQQAFDDMPSKVRDVFNTAGDFLQFMDSLQDNPEDSGHLESYRTALDLDLVDSKFFPNSEKFLSPEAPPEAPSDSDT